MLNALMYELRRGFLKKKSNIVFSILGVLASCFMIFVTHMISSENENVIRNPLIVASGISLIILVAFDLALATMGNGDLLFTHSDVNFYLAGPFTPRFNLLLPVITCLKSSLILMFILSFQGAVISSLLAVNALDMIILLLSVFVISAIGYTFAQIVNALTYEKDNVRKVIEGIFIAFQVVLGVVVLITLIKEAGSITAIPSLGTEKIIVTIGSNIFLKIIPFAGWLSLIVDGIIGGSIVKLILGIVLTVAGVALIYIVTNYFEFDYYEKAIESAQKIEERMAAQKAGVEAQLNAGKIKNDGKTHVGGFGASVFFYKHLNENKRISKLFFINKAALLYKVFVIVYSIIMSRTMGDEKTAMLSMVFAMICFMDTVVFAGGKAVVEITKPYFYLVPEKTSKKLLLTVLGGVPELIFNAIVAAGIITWINGAVDISLIGACLVFFTIFDLLCTYVAIIAGLIFTSFGKTLLTLVRYFVFWGIAGVIAVIVGVMAVAFEMPVAVLILVAAGVSFVFLIIAGLIASKLIDRAECR